MIKLLILIFMATALAYVVYNRTTVYNNGLVGVKRDMQSKLCYFAIILGLILFAGLRTKYNDTVPYMGLFQAVETDNEFSYYLDSYGGFNFYQALIKKYISTNSQSLIFISAVITNLLYVPFMLRYSKNFCESIFLFCINDFIFSMAGIKQAIAMGIALYAISGYLNKKYFKAILLLLLAMWFHPYVICLIAIPFLKKDVWSLSTVLVIIICFIAFMNMETVFNLLSIIGKDYSDERFDEYTINSMRVLVESVPVIISLIYSKKINKSDNVLLKLGVNMRIISFAFIFLALFVNPIYLGRMSTYFSILSSVVIPEMLYICWHDEKNGNLLKILYYAFFFVYFVLDMVKLGSIDFFYDQFQQTTLGNIF